MTPFDEFGLPVRLDSALLRADVALREAVPGGEVLSLAATAQVISISATLESRSLDRVKDCHALWTRIAELFREQTEAWIGVSCDEVKTYASLLCDIGVRYPASFAITAPVAGPP
jgi:hypothetical protein